MGARQNRLSRDTQDTFRTLGSGGVCRVSVQRIVDSFGVQDLVRARRYMCSRSENASFGGKHLPSRAGRQTRWAAGNVAGMPIETYVAILHDDEVTCGGGESVLCPLQPDGQPKPIIDHDGVLYDLLATPSRDGVFEYRRARA